MTNNTTECPCKYMDRFCNTCDVEETTQQYIARISTGRKTISYEEYMNLRD